MRSLRPLFAILPLGLIACNHFTSPARYRELEQPNGAMYWFDYAAERRGALVAPRGTLLTLCAEPAPDIALNQGEDLAATVTVPEGATADVKAKLATEVVQLAGRTQMVLFLRESMYRLCEQGMNGNLTPDQVRDLYEKIINSAVGLANAMAADIAAGAASDPETRALINKILGGESDGEE